MRPLGFVVPIALALAAFHITLEAGETGSISGVVKDSLGGVLPGAAVRVAGPLLPGGRQASATESGAYRFIHLSPGSYKVEATISGMGTLSRDVVVGIDRDTRVDLVLNPVLEETVAVSAAVPLVDTRSTEIASNFTREVIDDLPLGRTYSGLFELAPGVANNNSVAPNAGGFRQDNLFLYDGVNVTNPSFGDLFGDFSELDIQEINIKRGAISAEFGRTGGFVTNAVTRSGTNSVSGQGRIELQPSGFVGGSRDPSLVTKTDRTNAALGIGGPVKRDRVWFYASVNLNRRTETDRVNRLGPVPDADTDLNEYFGKITANPHPKHLLSASVRYRDLTRTHSGIDANSSPSVATNDKTEDTLAVATWTWFMSPTTSLDVRYNHDRNQNEGQPVTDLGHRPSFDPRSPQNMGSFRTTPEFIVGGATASGQTVGAATLFNRQDYHRDEIKGAVTHFRELGKTSHELKAGFGLDYNGEDTTRRANGWGSITFSSTAGIFNANYVPIQPTQNALGRSYSLFAQDVVGIGSRTNLSLGLLLNRDEYVARRQAQDSLPGIDRTLLSFGFGETLQPRIGLTFVTDPKVRDKAFVNYGRYYNLDNKSLSRAASPFRIFSSDAQFDLGGTLLRDVPRTSETGKVILPGIDPTHTDEFVAGYARPLGRTWSVEVWGMHRKTTDFIEDFPTTNLQGTIFSRPTPGSYVYGNLNGAAPATGTAFRKYRAVTVEVRRAWARSWAANASYTWSRLSGNWDLDYATSLFYASSALQDGPGLYVEDPNRDGILTGDRSHVFKLFAHAEVVKRTTLGGYLRVQSGAPWEARGQDYVGSYRRYLERAGSHRLGTWTNLDLLASHSLPAGKRVNLKLEARVLNVFGEQTTLAIDTRQDQPSFGQPTAFAPPRAFILTGYVGF